MPKSRKSSNKNSFKVNEPTDEVELEMSADLDHLEVPNFNSSRALVANEFIVANDLHHSSCDGEEAHPKPGSDRGSIKSISSR
jgi:hypothetical protein